MLMEIASKAKVLINVYEINIEQISKCTNIMSFTLWKQHTGSSVLHAEDYMDDGTIIKLKITIENDVSWTSTLPDVYICNRNVNASSVLCIELWIWWFLIQFYREVLYLILMALVLNKIVEIAMHLELLHYQLLFTVYAVWLDTMFLSIRHEMKMYVSTSKITSLFLSIGMLKACHSSNSRQVFVESFRSVCCCWRKCFNVSTDSRCCV